MSTDSITVDGFSALTPEAHALAIYLLSQRITWLKRVLKTPGLTQDALDAWLDELRHAHTLLKVHAGAIQEKLEDGQKPGVPAETDGITANAA